MGLLDNAVKALDDHWADITAMYGANPEYIGIVTRTKLAEKLIHLKDDRVSSVDELIVAAIKKAMEE
jgi:CRISPR system Cascade subunit CasC